MKTKPQDYKGSEFNLTELVNTAKRLIERSSIPPTDGRIAPFPDTRTVRYYQTVGILQKPLRYEGRNAIYGYHHLLQLIAIKLLQHQGLSLAQIQRALIQVTLKDLEETLEATIKKEEKSLKAESQQGFDITSPPLSMGKIEEKVTWREIKKRRSLEFPIYEKKEKKESRNLIAVEVVPGLSVVIDPEKVEDPKGVLSRIIQLLKENMEKGNE
jgi:DNA-binding transcriptional MerR regulator